MSDFLQSTRHNPNYGRIQDLCIALGYYREDTGKGPRTISCLKAKTFQYRIHFVTIFELERFPLNYQSEEAQRCASEFLHKNGHLFDNSDEGPVYPDDIEQYVKVFCRHTILTAGFRLTNGLAKLMCQQEFLQRSNMQTRQKARQKVCRLIAWSHFTDRQDEGSAGEQRQQ